MRVTLFVSGCTNHCPDCFQPQTWDFRYGRPFTHETETEIFRELDKPFISGLTVLGGEPFEPRNQRDLLPFLREIRRRYPRKNIWCFTGFRLEDELLQDGSYPRCEVTDDLLHCIDILVDGRFLREEKGHLPPVPWQPQPAHHRSAPDPLLRPHCPLGPAAPIAPPHSFPISSPKRATFYQRPPLYFILCI